MSVTARRIAAVVGGGMSGLATEGWMPASMTYGMERGLAAGVGLGLMVAALVRE